MAAAATVSEGPARLLGFAALAGSVLLFLGWRIARASRRATGPRSLFAVTAVVAIGASLLIVTAFGFRHYGGHTSESGAYRCDAWWAQMGSAHGVADGGGSAWPRCKRAAEKAVVPGAAEAGVGGLLLGTAAAFVVHFRRRRFNAQLRTVASAPGGS